MSTGGVDRLPHSRGIDGKEGGINAPTVYNSGFNFRQFWDGRAGSLEEQVNGPLQHPLEMAGSWPNALQMLSADSGYKKQFEQIYSDGIQAENVRDAIATFERSLYTPNSRFDQYLQGKESALTTQELNGYDLFKRIGCISCHQGINIGGNLYQKLGVMEDYFVNRGNLTKADMGLYNVTQRESDRYFFKVPSLRNVSVTPPYFHDASALTLHQAVKVMARYQLGKDLDANETADLVAFLKALTGEYQGKPLQ